MTVRPREQSIADEPVILIAPDKFRGSMTAPEAADALAIGIQWVLPASRLLIAPVADGGEGTLDAFVHAGGERRLAQVRGPLGDETLAAYGLRGRAALVEASEAIGLRLVDPSMPGVALAASSYGLGEMIRQAVDDGATDVTVALGGTATSDGGIGMIAALGFELIGHDGSRLDGTPSDLLDVARINSTDATATLGRVAIRVAGDVTNPLLGTAGASAVFAPQKGASPRDVEVIEARLTHWAETLTRGSGIDIAGMPGIGAAGGIAAPLVALLHAQIRSGAETVLALLGIDGLLSEANLVVTGEGSLDTQTLAGKAPAEVARRAHRRGLPVVAVAGIAETDVSAVADLFPTIHQLRTLTKEGEDSFRDAVILARRAGVLIAEMWADGRATAIPAP